MAALLVAWAWPRWQPEAGHDALAEPGDEPPSKYAYERDRIQRNAYAFIAMLPELPAPLRTKLIERGVLSSKTSL